MEGGGDGSGDGSGIGAKRRQSVVAVEDTKRQRLESDELPLPPPSQADIEAADERAADASTTDAGLLDTITRKNALAELGVTFELFKRGLCRRSQPHPRIIEVVGKAGVDGIGLVDLRAQIQRSAKLERSVKGPYLLVYLRHFSADYRVEGGPLPRDTRIFLRTRSDSAPDAHADAWG